MWNIFEQPWTGLAAAVIALNVIAVVRWFVPLSRKWLFLPPAVIAVAALALCYLVHTDREKVRSVIMQGVKAVRQQNPAGLEKLFSADYSDATHATKKDFVRSWRIWLAETKIESAGLSDAVYELRGGEASAVFDWTVRFGRQTGTFDNMSGTILRGRARVLLAEEADGRWLIRSSELLEIMGQPASWHRVRF
jgi:hypothetical protein